MNRLVLLLFTFVALQSAVANPISRQAARQQAEKFLEGKGISVAGEVARPVGNRVPSSKQSLYVFNATNNQGFVIIAGDDRVEPIIGYTTEGSFDASNLPHNFRAWLEQTAAEIESLRDMAAPSQAPSALEASPKAVAIHKKVPPMIITTWDQGNNDNVYNSHLPLINGQHPLTGCVATAGAQIMYYYRRDLPTMTQTVAGYSLLDDSGNDISQGADTHEDLPPIEFQWDKMKTQYGYKELDAPNTEEEDAVADLMLYCGYAAQMNYGVNGSSAQTYNLAEGMGKYFGFNPDSWKSVRRFNYSISEWDEIVYNELACSRPVIYSGSYAGGHAFICDGYDGEGMYHFNWGWGGNYNGYFKLQATNPYGELNINKMGFIADNHCIIGLQPSSWPAIEDPNADDIWDVPEIEGIVASVGKVQVDGNMVSMRFSNENEETYAFGFGMGELNDNGSITPLDTRKQYIGTELGQGWGFSGITFNVSSYNLPDGTHTLVPISLLSGESEWKRCKPADLNFEVNVLNGQKSIIAHPIIDLQINEFGLATGGTPGCYQGVVLNVTNNGDNLDKKLYLFVGNAEDRGTYFASADLHIASGNTKEYRFWLNSLEEGDYILRLYYNYNDDVPMVQTAITINQDLETTNFEIAEPRFVNSEMRVDVTVENHAGDYATPLYLFAGIDEDVSYRYAAGSAIESGGSEDVTFYFKPDQAGTWTLNITTDRDGKKVIGQTTVEIADAPTGEVTLNLVDSRVESFDNNSLKYIMTIENTGETTSYREIRAWLIDEDTNSTLSYKISPKVIIEPGETKEVSVSFDGLELDKQYYVLTNYSVLFSPYTQEYLGRYYFTYEAPEDEPLLGDANGDGVVDVADVVAIVNYILEKPADNFDAKAADVNGDEVIDAADVVGVVNIILNKTVD